MDSSGSLMHSFEAIRETSLLAAPRIPPRSATLAWFLACSTVIVTGRFGDSFIRPKLNHLDFRPDICFFLLQLERLAFLIVTHFCYLDDNVQWLFRQVLIPALMG